MLRQASDGKLAQREVGGRPARRELGVAEADVDGSDDCCHGVPPTGSVKTAQHRTADGSLPGGRPSNPARYRDQVARHDDLGGTRLSSHSHLAAAAPVLPQAAPRSHPTRSRQVPQSRQWPARHSCPGPSEAEVGRGLVNPSRSATRPRSRRAYRHISSLRLASRWHMIAVRQAGSFHTGRSAQSPRRRKPHQSGDLGRRGPRAPDPRGLDPPSSPTSRHGPRGHGLRRAHRHPPPFL